MAFDQLYTDLIRPFDKGIFDTASGDRAYLTCHRHTVSAHLVEGFRQISEAEAYVIYRGVLGGFECALTLPVIGVCLL